MKKSIVIVSNLFALALSACQSGATPTSTFTPVPAPTATPVLTQTALPLTEAPEAGSSLAPVGEPASEWNGIPIMPAAIAGEGDDESYVFTIRATPQEIQQYYELELGKLGWQPLAQGDEDASLMLIFTNESGAMLTVSIIVKGEESLVLLVK